MSPGSGFSAEAAPSGRQTCGGRENARNFRDEIGTPSQLADDSGQRAFPAARLALASACGEIGRFGRVLARQQLRRSPVRA